MFLRKFLILAFCFASFVFGETALFDSNGIFIPPARVTKINVQAWGGGGGGAVLSVASNLAGGGGGGSGSYSKYNDVAVTPGRIYQIFVGSGGISSASGGDSYFAADGINVIAYGGSGTNSKIGGNGAPASPNANLSVAGTKGGDGSVNAGGGGGGSASENNLSPSAGQNAPSNNTGGIGGSLGGGAGGDSRNFGSNGSFWGAGGGGAGRVGLVAGNGHSGCIIITYEIPPPPQFDIATGFTFDTSYGSNAGVVIYRPMPGVLNNSGDFAFRIYAKVGVSGVTGENDELLVSQTNNVLKIISREGDVVGDNRYGNVSYRNQRYLLYQLNISPTSYVIATNALVAPDGKILRAHCLSQNGSYLNAMAVTNNDIKNFLSPALPLDNQRYCFIYKKNTLATQNSVLGTGYINGNVETPVSEGQDVSSIVGDAAWLGEISSKYSTNSGLITFIANLQNNPLNKLQKTNPLTNQALFKYTTHAGLEMIARKGQTIPNTNIKIESFLSVSCDAYDKAAFIIRYKRQNLKFGYALILKDITGLRCIACSEMPLPQGELISYFGSCRLTSDSKIVFTAWLANVTPTTDCIICRWSEENGIEILVREGGAFNNEYFHTITKTSVSSSGVIVFLCTIANTTPYPYKVSPKVNSGVFKIKNGIIEKVVQIGQPIRVNGVDLPVRSFDFYNTAYDFSDASSSCVNDNGEVLISLSFGGGIHMNKVFK